MSLSSKYFWLILLLSGSLLTGFCQSPSPISITQGKFTQDGKPWFALTLNYQVDIFTDDETVFWIGPNHGYSKNNQRCCNNQLDARMALFSDFARIKEMGFNTVRICGLELQASNSSNDKKLWVNCKKGVSLDNIPFLSSKKNNKVLASMAKAVVEEAHDAGLQVIFLTGKANLQRNKIQEKYTEWLEILCDTLKKTSPIFAIDIFNEPIYSNSSKLSKNELFLVTEKWYKSIKKRLPKTLVTIGLIGPEDILEWDPEALNIDFVNYHLYPTNTDFEYVAASLHWISQTSKKPWIVGETGYSGTDDSTQKFNQGSASDQLRYATFSFNRALCKGAQGYSWWMFRDLFWGNNVDNMGLVDHQGKDKLIVPFFKTISLTTSQNCPLPDDLHYYRMEYTDYTIQGKIENMKGMPFPNAVICAWDADWKNFKWTISDKNGNYNIGSNTPIKFVRASAAGCNVYQRIIIEREKSIKLKNIVLTKLIF
ncbi:MAG: cellulase family glycosylhydrolase [Bacteroidota bacterium]